MPACLSACRGRTKDAKASVCVCDCVLDLGGRGSGGAGVAHPTPVHHLRRLDCLTAGPHSRNGTSCCCLLLVPPPLLARSSLASSPAPDCGFQWSLARNCPFFVGGLLKASSELPDVND